MDQNHSSKQYIYVYELIYSFKQNAPEQSVFVLHACAHNPTGIDPTSSQWESVASAIKECGHFAFFDCAYQGFASGDLDRDAFAVRKFVELGLDLFVAQSYSKNFGLYCERTGCLTVVSKSPEIAKNVRSQLSKLNRSSISNPPAFGARIVGKILNDAQLYKEWMSDLHIMVDRILTMRRSLYEHLVDLKTPGSWDHVINQIGMFSYTGLSIKQSLLMREKFHIYMTDNGRISIAGLTTKNIEYFATSMDWIVRNCKE